MKLMKWYIPNELLAVLENWLGDGYKCIKWGASTRLLVLYVVQLDCACVRLLLVGITFVCMCM